MIAAAQIGDVVGEDGMPPAVSAVAGAATSNLDGQAQALYSLLAI